MVRLLLLSVAFVLGLAAPVRAHQSSVKYVDLTVDGAAVTVAITIAPSDVTEPLGLPEDAKPGLAEATAPATIGKVASFVRAWLAITPTGGAACTPGPATAGPDADAKFVAVRWTVTCAGDTSELVLDFSRFFAIDLRHEAIVTVHAPGEEVEPIVVRATEQQVTVGKRTSSSILAWIGYGMDHIYGGLDHICFVLALLLVVVIRREDDGTWQVRTPLSALRTTAVVVTAFTLAHSVTLISASLGWVRLPSRFVESLIAASIVYTAIEDVVRPDVRWRFVLTCAFGLIHGLGFASMLEELLPPSQVVVPLLSFNLGVEIGQLTVVVVAIPVLWAIARLAGAERYRRFVLPVLAAPLVVVGAQWLIERM